MAKITLQPATSLYPVPAVMVSCGNESGEANIITIAWTGVLCSDPPVVSIGVRESRHSHAMIADTGEFVVNIPAAAQVKALDLCGVVSGSDDDKFRLTGLTAAPAAELEYAPIIEECPINLECQVIDRLSLGSHDCFVGQIVAVRVDEGWTDGEGGIRLRPQELIAYARGAYYGLGQALGAHGFAAPGKN